VVEILEAQMTSKTREAIKEVVLDLAVCDISTGEAIAKICAIVDKEREGEVVVLESVEVGHDGCIYLADHEIYPQIWLASEAVWCLYRRGNDASHEV
jgi:hypothetical protein